MSVNLMLLIRCPITVCLWVVQACSEVGVRRMLSRADENLSYLCLGATSLLVPETFEFTNFEA